LIVSGWLAGLIRWLTRAGLRAGLAIFGGAFLLFISPPVLELIFVSRRRVALLGVALALVLVGTLSLSFEKFADTIESLSIIVAFWRHRRGRLAWFRRLTVASLALCVVGAVAAGSIALISTLATRVSRVTRLLCIAWLSIRLSIRGTCPILRITFLGSITILGRFRSTTRLLVAALTSLFPCGRLPII
jgi:hypothetical protein